MEGKKIEIEKRNGTQCNSQGQNFLTNKME